MPEEAANAMFATPRTGAMPSTTDTLAEYARLGIRPISGGSGEDDVAAKAAADAKATEEAKAKADADAKAKADADETAKLGDAGKKALDAERDARSAADKRAKEAEKELAALRKKAEEDEAAKAKEAEAEAARKGEFEKLATDRATTIATVTAERDDFKTRYENAVAQIKPGVDTKWATLPAEVSKLYRGAEDDPIAKSAFIAESEPLIQALAGRGATGPSGPAWPNTPRPNGATLTAVQVAQAETERARATGKYAI